MFGVWMWPESIRRRGTEAVFDACQRAGVSDVFFLTKGLAGTTAFLTDAAPPMEPGRDLLREALDAAHARDMKLHAWFTSASDAHYRAEHPASGLYHYVKGRGKDVVSVADPEYLRFMQTLLADLTRSCDVDGIHFDYIRYNHLIYGWSEEDLRRYASRGVDTGHVRRLMDRTFVGESPDKDAIFDAFRAGDEDVIRLAEARRRDVAGFAGALTQTVRHASPNGKTICLSAALMPEGAYDDLAFADLHYGQHYADLAAMMDLFLPMAYSHAYGKGPDWVKQVAEGTLRYGAATVTGLQAYEGGTGVSLANDRKAAEEVPGTSGVCLFREGACVWTFLRDEPKFTLLNPLPAPVASVRINAGEESADIPLSVGPGEKRELTLPFPPQTVQVFDGDGRELCAAAVREKP